MVLTATLYQHVKIKRCACCLPKSRIPLYPESCHCVLVQTPRDCPWPARTEISSPKKPSSCNSTFLPTPSSSAIGTLCLIPLCPTASPVTHRKFKVVTLGSIQCSEKSISRKHARYGRTYQPTLHLKSVQLRRCSRQSHHLLCNIARVKRLSRVLVWWSHTLMSHRLRRSQPSPTLCRDRLQLASSQRTPFVQ